MGSAGMSIAQALHDRLRFGPPLDRLHAADEAPDGHPKLPHLWPVKLLQAGRTDYDGSGVMAMRAAASLRR